VFSLSLVSDVEIRLLGPVEARSAGRSLELGPAKRRCVLAALAVTAGYAVPIEVVAERVWGERPPADWRGVLYSYITRLRKALGGAEVVSRHSGGYLLAIEPDGVDLIRFRRRCTRARCATTPEAAAELLREGLAGWRGLPLADLSGTWVDLTRDSLIQQRLAALTQLGELELGLGHHAELVNQLAEWLAEYPLAEPLAGQLMRAYALTGHRAEALEVYARTRERLVEELGEDTGPDLQRIHLQILRRDPALEATAQSARIVPAVGDVPRQLPGSPSTFVGRSAEQRSIAKVLLDKGPGTATVAIYGPGGVGKSALALRVAQDVAHDFPDGQLYADLQGSSAGLAPLAAIDVVGRLLRALGVDGGRVPKEPAEATALLRSLLAERRMLIVLDNAAEAAQVRPLLPGASASATLVTSRTPLTTLDDAIHVGLDVLCPEESAATLALLDGSGRCAADSRSAHRLAELCGHLPLALRIVAARVMARPAWPLEVFVAGLADQRRRLDELDHAELNIRSCFDVAYSALADSTEEIDRAAARAFRLLGLPEARDLSHPIVARLIDLDEQATTRVLGRLLDAQLLQNPFPGRYRMHDLVLAYARETAHREEPEEERRNALVRAWSCWIATAQRAARLCRTGQHGEDFLTVEDLGAALELPDFASATAWLDAEYPNLLHAAGQAAEPPGQQSRFVVAIEFALNGYLEGRGLVTEAEALIRQAISAARTLDDDLIEGRILRDLGLNMIHRSRMAEARTALLEALARLRQANDLAYQGSTLRYLGMVHIESGELPAAVDVLGEALEMHRRTGDQLGEAITFETLGMLRQQLAEHDTAASHFASALAVYRELGDIGREAGALNNLALTLLSLDRTAEAIEATQLSLDIYRKVGNRRGRAVTLGTLGTAYVQDGRKAEAVNVLEEALKEVSTLELPRLEAGALIELAHALRLAGRAGEAAAHAEKSLAISRRHGLRQREANAAWQLGEALLDLGQREKGRSYLVRAQEIFGSVAAPTPQRVLDLLSSSD
jgi:DNA-binding SARP family transcriptional activator/tetratricopeptide (TPR) repeat protein